MLSMLQEHSSSWLLPAIGDFAYTQDGPLVSWAGALSILVFGPFFELFLSPLDAAITAARLPNILWFLILTFCFWQIGRASCRERVWIWVVEGSSKDKNRDE